jgi:hypothetical protein
MTMTPYLHMVPGALLLAGALTDLVGQGDASRRGPRLAAALLLAGAAAVGVMIIAAAFAPGSDAAVLWLHRGFAVAASITALGVLALRPEVRKSSLRRQQLRMISVGLVGLLAAVAIVGGFVAHRSPALAHEHQEAAIGASAGGLCQPQVRAPFNPSISGGAQCDSDE